MYNNALWAEICLSKGQIGWLAGIVDGEGSIAIHKR